MQVNHWFRFTFFAGAVLALTACSYLGSLFPDKQKQYRYSSELPDLEVPPDLSAAKIQGREDESPSRGSRIYEARKETDTESKAAETSDQAKPDVSESSSRMPAKKRKPVKHDSSSVTLAESSDNVALIEMQEPFAESWNDVSRALGRLKIEISDQNRSDGVFYVYYGGEAPKKAGETSIWDDMTSFFSTEKDLAHEYRIKLENKEEVTYVQVLDRDEKPVSEGAGLELLKRLHDKLLNLDQPEAEGEETKPGEESEKK